MSTVSPSPDPGRDRRAQAYKAGGRIARDRIAREAPLDAQALADVEASDLVVVGGIYDHVEQVLSALEMPFTRGAGRSVLAGRAPSRAAPGPELPGRAPPA